MYIDLYESIAKVCRQQKEILAAFVFGSRARGGIKPKSDTDIAVLLDENEKPVFDYLECKASIERALTTEVDLVVLNDAGEFMKYQVRSDGHRVYDRDPEKRKQWELMSRKFYQDYLHLHSIYMHVFYNKLETRHG